MKQKIFAGVAALALLVGLVGLFLPSSLAVEPRAEERISINCITESDYCVNAYGNKIVLDVDEDTYIQVSTDDVLSIAPGGTAYVNFGIMVAADAAANSEVFEIYGTTPIDTTGTSDHSFLVIDAAIGNASGGTNTVQAIDIEAITADAQVTESAIYIGAGWDNDIEAVTNFVLSIDAQDVLTISDQPAASAGGDVIDSTLTLGTSDGTDDDFIFLDVNLTGSATEAARDVIGLELTLTDGADTDYLPMAIKMDAGWDTFLIMGASGNGSIWKEVPIAGAGGDVIDFTDTLGTSDGTDDDFIFLDVNITGAATEAARDVVGIDLGFTDGSDTDSLAYAIELQSGWDNYLYVDSGAFVLAPIPAANSSGDTIDFTDTLNATDGTDHYKFLDINITENAVAATTDTGVGIDLAWTAGDGDTVASALAFQAGWDHDLNFITSGEIAVDSAVMLTLMDQPANSAGGDIIDSTFTLNTSDDVNDDFIWLDLNITGSGTEAARDVVGIDLGFTDGAGTASLAYAIEMQAGWDSYLYVDSGTFNFAPVPANSAGGDSIDFTDTLGTSDGADDDYIFMDINLTGAATEAARDVVGIDLGFTDGADTDSLAYAMEFQAGWDSYIVIDSGALTINPVPATLTSGDVIDFTDTTTVTDGTDAFIFMDVNITEAATAVNTDTAIGIDLGYTPDDGDTIPSAIVFQAGWDHDLNFITDGIISVDSNIVLTLLDPPAANASGDAIDFTDTMQAMDGTDAWIFFDINPTLGAMTGTGNTFTVFDIAAITDDAQGTTAAIKIGDEWNYALDTTAPVIATAMYWFDDFIGDTVNATYTEISGVDGQAVQAIVEEQYGVYQLTSGDVGDTPANDLEAITLSLEWQADQGSLVMEVRLHMDTAVETAAMCVGFVDDVSTVQMPFIIGGGDAITSNAPDAIAFCYDTDSDADNWFFLGVANNTDATGNATTGEAPAGGVYQVLRIEVDAGGADARGYIDGVLVGTLTANAVTATDLLAPWIGVDSHAAASRVVDIDYIIVSADRD